MYCSNLKLPEWAVKLLHCSVCNDKLILRNKIECMNKNCGEPFLIMDNISILID